LGRSLGLQVRHWAATILGTPIGMKAHRFELHTRAVDQGFFDALNGSRRPEAESGDKTRYCATGAMLCMMP